MVMTDRSAVHPVRKTLLIRIPETERKAGGHRSRELLLQFKIILLFLFFPAKLLKLRHQPHRSGRHGRRHTLSAVLDNLILIIHIRPQPAITVHAVDHQGQRIFQPLPVLLQPFKIPGSSHIKPCRLDHLDIAGHQEHNRICFTVHAASSDMVFPNTARLKRAGITIQSLRVLPHQLELQIQHPLYQALVKTVSCGDTPLNLKFMVHIRIGSRINLSLQRADHISFTDRIVCCRILLCHTGQQRSPVKLIRRLLQNVSIREIQPHAVSLNIASGDSFPLTDTVLCIPVFKFQLRNPVFLIQPDPYLR